MGTPREAHAVRLIAAMIEEFLDLPPGTASRAPDPDSGDMLPVLVAGSYAFVIGYTGMGSVAQVSMAIERIRMTLPAAGPVAIPLVVAPYLGQAGRRRCADAGYSWIDLSGNAHISAPGLVIRIDGRPNQFRRPGRPSSAFAPRASRITRWLLMHPDVPLTADLLDDAAFKPRLAPRRRGEVADEMEVDRGFTSRVVAKLLDNELVSVRPDGTILPTDPALLLDAWAEDYDFARHDIIRGHVAARSGADLLRKIHDPLRGSMLRGVADDLGQMGLPFAATGLAGAWLINQFAGFRLTTVYLPQNPSEQVLDEIGFRREPRGANVWLVIPNDMGVFWASRVRHGIQCVHPVQVYLDLQVHPERAPEAAERLREDLIQHWRSLYA